MKACLDMREKLIIILGPTAVGKTDLSLEIAEKFQGEIISGDSMQVYKYMDIGTAKLPLNERRGIPHHLLDILDPAETYNVARFQKEAKKLISEINSRHKIPVIAGGTGLYISSVINPYLFKDSTEDTHEYRAQKLVEFQKDQGLSLHRELGKIDPKAAQRIHHHDSHRLIRALEFFHYNGYPISEAQTESQKYRPAYTLALIGLTMERERLFERINRRVDQMLAQNLIGEVENLLKMGYQRELNSMQGLGYRQIAAYLEGEYTLEEAKEKIKIATRRFAKRQMTWFKRMNSISWFNKSYYPDRESLNKDVICSIRQALGED